MNNIDATLAALAEPTRRRVVDLLRERPRPAGELAAASGMSRPAMSRHLRVLRASGLVDEEGVEHDARLRVYRLRQEPFLALQAWLDQVEAFWRDQLGAFKAYADRTRSNAHPASADAARTHPGAECSRTGDDMSTREERD